MVDIVQDGSHSQLASVAHNGRSVASGYDDRWGIWSIIRYHPVVREASDDDDQGQPQHERTDFLLVHIDQADDGEGLDSQGTLLCLGEVLQGKSIKHVLCLGPGHILCAYFVFICRRTCDLSFEQKGTPIPHHCRQISWTGET